MSENCRATPYEKISTSVYVLKLRGKKFNLNEISTLGGRDREQRYLICAF